VASAADDQLDELMALDLVERRRAREQLGEVFFGQRCGISVGVITPTDARDVTLDAIDGEQPHTLSSSSRASKTDVRVGVVVEALAKVGVHQIERRLDVARAHFIDVVREALVAGAVLHFVARELRAARRKRQLSSGSRDRRSMRVVVDSSAIIGCDLIATGTAVACTFLAMRSLARAASP